MAHVDSARVHGLLADLPHRLAGDAIALASLRSILLAEAPTLALAGQPAPCTGELGDDVLVCVALDANASLALLRVPSERLGPTLDAALEIMHGRVLADTDELDWDEWDAAVALLAALALEFESPESLHAWASEAGSSLALDDVRGLWNRWAGLDVRAWSQLEHAPARVCALRRAVWHAAV